MWSVQLSDYIQHKGEKTKQGANFWRLKYYSSNVSISEDDLMDVLRSCYFSLMLKTIGFHLL